MIKKVFFKHYIGKQCCDFVEDVEHILVSFHIFCCTPYIGRTLFCYESFVYER
jgi:hypothetical protein